MEIRRLEERVTHNQSSYSPHKRPTRKIVPHPPQPQYPPQSPPYLGLFFKSPSNSAEYTVDSPSKDPISYTNLLVSKDLKPKDEMEDLILRVEKEISELDVNSRLLRSRKKKKKKREKEKRTEKSCELAESTILLARREVPKRVRSLKEEGGRVEALVSKMRRRTAIVRRANASVSFET